MFKYLVILIALSTCLSGWSASAQTPEQEHIQELETENDRLRSELAQLRLELSQLKREFKKIRPQPPEDATEPAEQSIEEKPARHDADKDKRVGRSRSTMSQRKCDS